MILYTGYMTDISYTYMFAKTRYLRQVVLLGLPDSS